MAVLAKACMPPWKVTPIISTAEPREPQGKGLKGDRGEWGNTPQGNLDTVDQLCLLEEPRWGEWSPNVGMLLLCRRLAAGSLVLRGAQE